MAQVIGHEQPLEELSLGQLPIGIGLGGKPGVGLLNKHRVKRHGPLGNRGLAGQRSEVIRRTFQAERHASGRGLRVSLQILALAAPG